MGLSDFIKERNITYMDCWHFIAPLIPISEDDLTTQIYVMTYKALADADEREEERRRNDRRKRPD